MYSVILMAAMTTPADVPSFGRLFRGGCVGSCVGCTGFSGCVGYACGGCVGSCAGCTGCVGSACSGCAGVVPNGYACGGCGGRFLGWRAGCWSDGGWRVWFSCHGSGACHGYAYAGLSYGFAGCYGSCTGSFTNYFSYWPAPAAPAPTQSAPPAATPMQPNEPKKEAPKTDPMKPMTSAAPASVIITLPADARLLANGVPTRQTGSERRFITPELTLLTRHMYSLTAEISRDDQTITETIDIEVFPGQETRVIFRRLLAFLGQEPAGIAGK
jgi:uncharacterized protein (TIGR03000 family)